MEKLDALFSNIVEVTSNIRIIALERIDKINFKVITEFRNLLNRLLQQPTKLLTQKCSGFYITYMNKYVIRDIEYSKDYCIYYGFCNYGNHLYTLHGATLDALMLDLIESIEEVQQMSTYDSDWTLNELS